MKTRLNLKFEKFEYDQNLNFIGNIYNGNLGNFFGKENVRFSQIIEVISFFDAENFLNPLSMNEKNVCYIIPVAVYYCPSDWTDRNFEGKYNKRSFFEYLNDDYLNDLKKNKALLLIDQSVEGYHDNWLWKWFHQKCDDYKISPSSIIYITGNQSAAEQYDIWLKNNNFSSGKLKVISSTSLQFYIYQTYRRNKMNIIFEDIVSYKKNNLDNVLLFDCLNLRPREHRVLTFLYLNHFNLLSRGKISFAPKHEWPIITNNVLKEYGLPLDIVEKSREPLKLNLSRKDNEYHNYVERILSEVYKDTWISIVTETTYFERENSVFISEKTFKPIACMQPFIIVGTKHTLKYLRKLGYKTFHNFIDETYDDLDDDERIAAIVKEIIRIQKIKNKIDWLNSMKDILEHNHRLFLSIEFKKTNENLEIIDYYQNYFRD